MPDFERTLTPAEKDELLNKIKYGGINYQKGKEQNKKLYCNFYERNAFRENSKLNTDYKCFGMDPLPSMEIILKGENSIPIDELMSIFIERKPILPFSEFCNEYNN